MNRFARVAIDFHFCANRLNRAYDMIHQSLVLMNDSRVLMGDDVLFVLCHLGYLAMEGGAPDIVSQVNDVCC